MSGDLGRQECPPPHELFLVSKLGFLDSHVLEFAGLEDVPTLLALDVLRLFVARNNLYARVLAQIPAYLVLKGLRRLARRHKLRERSSCNRAVSRFRSKLAVLCGESFRMSSSSYRLGTRFRGVEDYASTAKWTGCLLRDRPAS